jgi:hypothetical protein
MFRYKSTIRNYLIMVAVVRRKRQTFTSIRMNTGMWK